jgi:hypothetical protein
VFLTMAAGSNLYVVTRLATVAATTRRPDAPTPRRPDLLVITGLENDRRLPHRRYWLRPPSRAARGRTGRQTAPRLLHCQPACAASPPPLPASETANLSLTPAPNSSFGLPNRTLASWSYPP